MLRKKQMIVRTLSMSWAFGVSTYAKNRTSPSPRFLQTPSYQITIPPRDPDSQVVTIPERSEESIETPHHGLGKLFWIGWGLVAEMTVANAEMTKHCEQQPGCEVASVWGTKRPGRLQPYLPDAAVITAGMLFTSSWLHQDPNDKYSKVTIVGVDSILGVQTVPNVAESY